MVTVAEKKLSRIEDLVALTKEGKEIKASVQLVVRPIIEKALAEIGETEDMESYLLIGNFDISVNGQRHGFTKTYLRGYKSEFLEAKAANLKIANARLKADYERLRAADIDIEPQYFEEFHI